MKYLEGNNLGQAALSISIYKPRSTLVGSIAAITIEILPISVSWSRKKCGQGEVDGRSAGDRASVVTTFITEPTYIELDRAFQGT